MLNRPVAKASGPLVSSAWIGAVLAVGCARTNPNRPATRSECAAMHAKIVSLQPPAQRDAMTTLGLDEPDERTLTVCQERVTLEVISCVDRATSLDQALACHPSADNRPPNARRTHEECAACRPPIRRKPRSSSRRTARAVLASRVPAAPL